jgi:glycolate oxidase
MLNANIVAELRAIVGANHIFDKNEQLRTYESDGLTSYRVKPALVVTPFTTEEVQAVVRVCHREHIPFVPRGSGTGLSGGALPAEGGVLISVARMQQILDVDTRNQRVIVQPGVINAHVSQRLAPDGYYYAPDPSSQSVCSIGGNVGENSGGAHCLKYGFTVNHVLGMKLVLPDGELIEVGGPTLDAPGYDLAGIIVGSEGTFGIVTEVTLRILHTAEARQTALVAFAHTDAAGEAVSGIILAGIIPAAVEMMDTLAIKACEAAAHAGYPLDAGALLLIELDGPRASVAAQLQQVEEICQRAGASEFRLAQTEDERMRMWKGRKSAFAAMGRLSPNYIVQDGVIPRTALPEILREIEQLASNYGLRVANVFHAGDGNLHPLVLYDERNEGAEQKAEELAGAILKSCVDHGGSITGEHGVGIDKKRYLSLMFNEADMATHQLIRCALNPDNMCNPNKLYPTPRLCGELPGRYRPHPLEQAGVIDRF